MQTAAHIAQFLRRGYWDRRYAESETATAIAEHETGASWAIVTACSQISASRTPTDLRAQAVALKRIKWAALDVLRPMSDAQLLATLDALASGQPWSTFTTDPIAAQAAA